MHTVGDALTLLERWFARRWAQSWDSVGLVGGEPAAPLRAIHVAVDPVEAVAREAVAAGAGLLLTHHPLWLGGTERITGPRGAAYETLARAECALYVAHTNADVADPGVSDALADAVGLRGLRPLQPQDEPLDRWVVHVPADHAAAVLDAMATAGAGRFGDYDRCAFTSVGTGTFRPLPGATPYVGAVGRAELVAEERIETVAARSVRTAVAAAIRRTHPYEEPSLSVTESLAPTTRGLGRVGTLPAELTLQEFVAHVADRLPRTAAGIRATGAAQARVRTVAVAGGSTLDLAEAAHAAGADVFVTSDAKHHRAQDAPLPIVDVTHWAGEWPWTAAVGDRLRAAFPDVPVTVSRLVTDPWTMAAGHA